MFWAVAARFVLGVWNISFDTGPSVCGVCRSRDSSRRLPMGVEGSRKGMRAQIDGDKPSSLAELALFCRCRLLIPRSIISSRKVLAGADGSSTGVCSTWSNFRGSLAALSAGPQTT